MQWAAAMSRGIIVLLQILNKLCKLRPTMWHDVMVACDDVASAAYVEALLVRSGSCWK